MPQSLPTWSSIALRRPACLPLRGLLLVPARIPGGVSLRLAGPTPQTSWPRGLRLRLLAPLGSMFGGPSPTVVFLWSSEHVRSGSCTAAFLPGSSRPISACLSPMPTASASTPPVGRLTTIHYGICSSHALLQARFGAGWGTSGRLSRMGVSLSRWLSFLLMTAGNGTLPRTPAPCGSASASSPWRRSGRRTAAVPMGSARPWSSSLRGSSLASGPS
jgi:hypothetical protein